MNCKKLFVTSLASETGKGLKRENEIVFHWAKKKRFMYSQSNEFHQYYGGIFILLGLVNLTLDII